MKKLTGEELVSKNNPVYQSYVYRGSFNHLIPVDLSWRRMPEHDVPIEGIMAEELSLNEIKDQLKEQLKNSDTLPLITVFEISPMHGKIYQWGNYGDSWYEIGETSGYF